MHAKDSIIASASSLAADALPDRRRSSIVTDSAEIAALGSRLTAEFRAEWPTHQARLDREIQETLSRLASQGLGTSGAVPRDIRLILERGLEDAQRLLIDRGARLVARINSRLLPEATARARAVISAELNRLAAESDKTLASHQANLGFGEAFNVHAKLKALLITLDTDLETAIHLARETPRPWFEKPVGKVIIAVIGGLIVAMITARACAK